MNGPQGAPGRVMIIAGEASGDQHGAALVDALKRRNAGLVFAGIGGNRMRAAGVDVRVDARQLSVVGITEVFGKIPNLLRGLAAAKNMLKTFSPDLLVLIDFPDFNLHMAANAKKFGIPVFYYISPQIWAWRKGRVKKIKRRVDHMAVILPFEEAFYREHGVPATYVGHPLADAYPVGLPEKAGAEALRGPVVGLLPGSREKEVARILPAMLDAVELLHRRLKGLAVKVSVAPTIERRIVEGILSGRPPGPPFELVSDSLQRVLSESSLVVAASGTVTLDAAFYAVPMVIVYRVSRLSYRVGRSLVSVPHIGLVNLIAGDRIVPELVQDEAGGPQIARAVLDMLQNRSRLETVRRQLTAVREKLARPGASDRAAAIAMDLLSRVPARKRTGIPICHGSGNQPPGRRNPSTEKKCRRFN